MTLPFPRYRPELTQCLNGIWCVAYLGDVGKIDRLDPTDIRCNDAMAVAGAYDAAPALADRRGAAVYRTHAEVAPGRAAQLRFDGLGLGARRFVDGEPVGTFDTPYSDWRVIIPASERPRRQIVALIDNRLHAERPILVEPCLDFYLYGGIYRGVWLRELPGPVIDAVQVRVLDCQTRRVAVTAWATSTLPEDASLRMGFDDRPLSEVGHAEHADREIRFEADVSDPRQWSPTEPELHHLTTALGDDRFTTRFGLRTTRLDGPRLSLNDEPLKLKGVCRHESHPQFGPALLDAEIVQDVPLLKRLGCNFVRGSHYPQDPRFLGLCDEQGLLVFEESLGGQTRKKHFENPRFVDRVEAQTRRMVRKSFNHPAVIIWGFLNEANTDEPSSRAVYERLVRAIREEDPTRPVTFATHKPFADINLDLADIVSVNACPGWYAEVNGSPVRPLDEIMPKLDALLQYLANESLDDRPFILSEIGAGAIYGWRDPLRSHWSEDYQVDLIEVVCRKFRDDPRITGLAIWQFCDDQTYANSRALTRPRGFNNKGVFAEYRRPKRAAEVIAHS